MLSNSTRKHLTWGMDRQRSALREWRPSSNPGGRTRAAMWTYHTYPRRIGDEN